VRNNNGQFGARDNTLYLHYEGAGFEQWPVLRLSWLRYTVIFLIPVV